MLRKDNKIKSDSLFQNKLIDIINLKHPLCKLASEVDWLEIEEALSKFYNSKKGRPALPIRLMVSLLLLKQLKNISDESVVALWVENPYWQYFSGCEYLHWNPPCDPTELVKFRNRIGIEGIEAIFKASIKIHGNKAEEAVIVADTTVQEKNITYPTDTKLHLKIINKCLMIANKYNLKLRQSYKRTIKRLQWSLRYINSAKRVNEAKKAMRKIKTIAGRLLREIKRNLSPEQLASWSRLIEIMEKILAQKKDDKNKVYSIHEPEVNCISKGKKHKRFEFGSKASIGMTAISGIIVAAVNFVNNIFDGDTLAPTIEQANRLRKKKVDKALVDEGCRGRENICGAEIIRAHRLKNDNYSKYKMKKWFGRRAAIEPVIGHLKSDFRLERNYLKGTDGDAINLMLSASAFNIAKRLNELIFILRLFIRNFLFKFDYYKLLFS